MVIFAKFIKYITVENKVMSSLLVCFMKKKELPKLE